MIIAGIMSGTSLDGIDAAIIETNGRRVRTLGFHSEPYSSEVREALLAVSNREAHVGQIARLNFLLPELYAAAFKKACTAAKLEVRAVEAIGCHGQTVYHEGCAVEFCGHAIASTLQLGDGNVLAARTGVTVVCDFRTADIAAGGQGAPLVPFADHLLFQDEKLNRVGLNIGGIANVTFLPAGGGVEDVVAFDTGPGNMVMDQLAAHYSRGARNRDENGEMAAQGAVQPDVLAEMLSDKYFTEKPPKSAGREQYGGEFVDRLLRFKLSPEDTLATATYFTAGSIADGIARFASPEAEPDEVIVAGGGIHNPTLMRFLRAELPESTVRTSDELGVDADAKEAIAFALLARETLRQRPSNLPSATGAKRAMILGKICRP